ncbi:hypothetical protein L2E82_52368 [Cichorium intybus]|nr:hypothetical protein L2E82_52368 [Cichorium intybus]
MYFTQVVVVDNYFTGSKDNHRQWFGHSRFELIRRDITEPLMVEVDQIYHLACPASPVFYKYNDVKELGVVTMRESVKTLMVGYHRQHGIGEHRLTFSKFLYLIEGNGSRYLWLSFF